MAHNSCQWKMVCQLKTMQEANMAVWLTFLLRSTCNGIRWNQPACRPLLPCQQFLIQPRYFMGSCGSAVRIWRMVGVPDGRSWWTGGLRRGATAAWLLGSRVRIQLRACTSCLVFAECRVGSGLCQGLIVRSE